MSDTYLSDSEKNKAKKNKSTSQQVNLYKTKAKSNTKYIEELKDSEKSDNL
jgi:hypothetical protein